MPRRAKRNCRGDTGGRLGLTLEPPDCVLTAGVAGRAPTWTGVVTEADTTVAIADPLIEVFVGDGYRHEVMGAGCAKVMPSKRQCSSG